MNSLPILLRLPLLFIWPFLQFDSNMFGSLLLASLVGASSLGSRSSISECTGYQPLNVNEKGSYLTADLILNGDPCNAYGEDLQSLKLLVEYQTGGYYMVMPTISY